LNPELHKARWPYSHADLFGEDRDGMVGRYKRAIAWLESSGRNEHFVNAYLNDLGDRGELVFVLSQRDTALLLKLAVG